MMSAAFTKGKFKTQQLSSEKRSAGNCWVFAESAVTICTFRKNLSSCYELEQATEQALEFRRQRPESGSCLNCGADAAAA